MSKYRIPSVIALFLGFLLIVYAQQLAGPKLPDGSRDERGFIIHTAASMGGVLICVFALAEMLYSARMRWSRRIDSRNAVPETSSEPEAP